MHRRVPPVDAQAAAGRGAGELLHDVDVDDLDVAQDAAVDDAGAEAQERRRRQRPDVRSGAPAHREPPVGRGAFYELISSATWDVFTRETRLET